MADLMEGITQEAASLAGHLRLGKLISLYDQNRITLAGGVGPQLHRRRAEALRRLWLAYPRRAGWQRCRRAHRRHRRSARPKPTGPRILLVHTHIGYGSPKKQDNFSSHGNPLGEDELLATKKALGWPSTEKFFLPQEAVDFFRQAIGKGAKAQEEWNAQRGSLQGRFPAEGAEFEMISAGKLPDDWAADLPKWKPSDKSIATRVAGGEVLNALAKRIPNIIGGSADLNPSTNTALKGMGDFQPPE